MSAEIDRQRRMARRAPGAGDRGKEADLVAKVKGDFGGAGGRSQAGL
jgi:hypothetical protein